MSSSTVYTAFKDRLTVALGGAYPIRDWEEIEQVLQQERQPFLAIDDAAGQSVLESIGDPTENWTRDTGTIVVHAFVPSNGPLGTARGIGDQVAQAMRYFRFSAPSGETMRCLNVDPPGPGVIHDGLWHSMMIPVDYEHMYAVATAAE